MEFLFRNSDSRIALLEFHFWNSVFEIFLLEDDFNNLNLTIMTSHFHIQTPDLNVGGIMTDFKHYVGGKLPNRFAYMTHKREIGAAEDL